jgi:hypothetical protein
VSHGTPEGDRRLLLLLAAMALGWLLLAWWAFT